MSPATPEIPDYQEVIDLYDAGRFADMCVAARRVVGAHPDHPRAWHLLGLGCLLLGEPGEALAALRRASEVQPDNPEVWDHLGAACNFLGRFPEALAASTRCVALDAQRAESWINHGKNLRDSGQLAEAIAAYQRAIALNGRLVEGHNNLGVALLDGERFADAAMAFRAAIAVRPDYAWAHNNLGIALRELGQPEAALAACQRALELDPDNSQAWNNLGNIEHQRGQEPAALAAYEKARELAPDDADVLNNIGSSLAVLHRTDDAVAAFRGVLAQQPDNARAWNNLGNALPDVADKVAAFRRAIALAPDLAQARSNLLFSLHYLPEVDDADLLAQARAFGSAVGRRVVPCTDWANDRQLDRPLRIGFVSADLCQHPVAYFFESVLGALDCARIVPFAYYNERKEDAWTARFRAQIPNWRNIYAQPDVTVRDQIRADRIDILVDLSGHTAGNRLGVFAMRPAPVQVSWLGYFGTTGVPGIDYLLADHPGAPAEYDDKFTERLWRLPETRLCFTAPPELPVAAPPSQRSGQITFGCFNNHNKIHDGVIAVWARILAAVPGAALLLKNGRATDAGYRDRLLARFAEHGITAGAVRFAGLSDRETYLAGYGEIDITLDPFPYTGGTTTAESLWMGVPVLTLRGRTLIGRQGAGLLQAAGLNEWIADSEADYVALARGFAGDPAGLARLRRGLRQRLQGSTLMDAARLARQLENAWRGMWIQYCARAS